MAEAALKPAMTWQKLGAPIEAGKLSSLKILTAEERKAARLAKFGAAAAAADASPPPAALCTCRRRASCRGSQTALSARHTTNPARKHDSSSFRVTV